MVLEIRPATIADLPSLERRCWRGGEAEMERRIGTQGTCSLIVVDDGRTVGQLYLRAYEPGARSPSGLHDGAWWADLKGVEGHVSLPERTAILGCWHVGRVRLPDGTEAEAEEYRGRGLGIALLEAAVRWLDAGSGPFDALAAKAADTEERAYLGWLGGLPHAPFEALSFRTVATFDDPYLVAEPDAVPEAARAVTEHPARFHLMVRDRRGT